MNADDFLSLVAGDLCPCGHRADRHLPAAGGIPGEKFGACRVCECQGVIDATDDEE